MGDKIPAEDTSVRACAADLRPLTPKQRVYCSDACKQLVRLWRLKTSLAAKVRS